MTFVAAVKNRRHDPLSTNARKITFGTGMAGLETNPSGWNVLPPILVVDLLQTHAECGRDYIGSAGFEPRPG